MAAKKEISGFIKLQIKGGQANPAPPVGPALGQRGVNIMEFCKAFNDKTKSLAGKPVPVEITVYKDKKFDFKIKSPPASYYIREAAKLRKIECELNIQKAEAAGKVTVELQSELKDLRKQEARWEAELKRDEGKLNLRMKESSHKTDQAMALFEQVQAKKRERIAQTQEHQNQRMDKQNELQVKMMEMAAQNDALTPEVMQEFLRQQTAQKAVDGPGIESQDSPQNNTNNSICPSCSKQVMPDWKACPHCGIAL